MNGTEKQVAYANNIKIVTKLHEGIEGGGTAEVYYTKKLTPVNLIRMVEKLSEHRASFHRSYGSIGKGSSWIEVENYILTNEDEMFLSDDFGFSDRKYYAEEIIKNLI